MPRKPCSIRGTYPGETAQVSQSRKGGTMEDHLVEMLSWLFVKTEEEILAEAEIAALHSMLLAEDPRPERAGQ